MLLTTLDVTLKLDGPVLCRDSSPQIAGIDSAMCRTRQRPSGGNKDETYMLPFSHVKGRLRWSISDLYGEDKAREVFGRSSPETAGENDAMDPWRGRVGISDFYEVAQAGVDQTGVVFEPFLVNIAIDHKRKAAKRGAVHLIENAFPTGTTGEFAGQIYYFSENRETADTLTRLIVHGLRWTPTYGAMRTIGFGRVISVTAIENHVEIREPIRGSSEEFLDLRLNFLDPFCIAKRRISLNTFESSPSIPGGVLKGAVASMLNAMVGRSPNAEIDETLPGSWKVLGREFSKIRFLHALPSKASEKRPRALPLSLMRSHSRVCDAAALTSPVLLDGEAPAFAVDWKESEATAVRLQMGISEPETELRVRTAIDQDSWRAADEKLFAYQMMIPGDLVWRTRLDLSRIDGAARPDVLAALRSIFSIGVFGIGKSKARVHVTEVAGAEPESPIAGNTDPATWIVTLQTPALLLNHSSNVIGADGKALFGAYAEAWSELSGAALKLQRLFARQSLAGGYLARRFRPSKPYNPFLLTELGSVFVLKEAPAQQKKVKDLLTEWLRYGLPLPARIEGEYGSDWKSNPYVLENGFGEIAVNMRIHEEMKPNDSEITQINPPAWWTPESGNQNPHTPEGSPCN
jgi:CRISPR/Cas system CSM-associated protein Csm3 (group 7 of RAMP superfamily)